VDSPNTSFSGWCAAMPSVTEIMQNLCEKYGIDRITVEKLLEAFHELPQPRSELIAHAAEFRQLFRF
jgi:hypothetical protein